MQFDLISWLIGVPTGIGINWLSQWLYHKFFKKKPLGGDYFTATYSQGGIDFGGRIETHISAEEIVQRVLESIKKEPKP